MDFPEGGGDTSGKLALVPSARQAISTGFHRGDRISLGSGFPTDGRSRADLQFGDFIVAVCVKKSTIKKLFCKENQLLGRCPSGDWVVARAVGAVDTGHCGCWSRPGGCTFSSSVHDVLQSDSRLRSFKISAALVRRSRIHNTPCKTRRTKTRNMRIESDFSAAVQQSKQQRMDAGQWPYSLHSVESGACILRAGELAGPSVSLVRLVVRRGCLRFCCFSATKLLSLWWTLGLRSCPFLASLLSKRLGTPTPSDRRS